MGTRHFQMEFEERKIMNIDLQITGDPGVFSYGIHPPENVTSFEEEFTGDAGEELILDRPERLGLELDQIWLGE